MLDEELNPNRTILLLHMKENCNYPKNYPENYINELNKSQKEILLIIKEKPSITVNEISNLVDNITLAGVKWNLKQLKEKGILAREGSSRKGRWIVL